MSTKIGITATAVLNLSFLVVCAFEAMASPRQIGRSPDPAARDHIVNGVNLTREFKTLTDRGRPTAPDDSLWKDWCRFYEVARLGCFCMKPGAIGGMPAVIECHRWSAITTAYNACECKD